MSNTPAAGTARDDNNLYNIRTYECMTSCGERRAVVGVVPPVRVCRSTVIAGYGRVDWCFQLVEFSRYGNKRDEFPEVQSYFSFFSDWLKSQVKQEKK